MSKPPTPDYPTKLKIRSYACRASARRIKEGLVKLVETSLAFNESWLLGEFDEGSRIGGLNQHGDIIVRHFPRRPKSELTIEYRAGDEALALVIEANFGNVLTPKAPRMATGSRRPAGLAYFLEMVRLNPVKRSLLIADAAIEEAHDLAFSDYVAARTGRVIQWDPGKEEIVGDAEAAAGAVGASSLASTPASGSAAVRTVSSSVA